ncbi:MAG: hypothetical protein H6721_15080 [Sandaracinus sp.]|nr:hypothetical protein [Sandaracinus sp.]MCB9633437.1 hypothetical protein [Sandaracinus sp.]
MSKTLTRLVLVSVLAMLPLASVAAQQAPAGTETLAMRLQARHPRDVPSAERLSNDADRVRLRWLAEHHTRPLVRARALLLLASDPSAETRSLVLRVLDSHAPALVRAAALQATTTWTLDAALRARLERLAHESDPRLQRPARERLATARRPSTTD